ncbi:MAG: PIN domain-containing protein [Kiritimatiellae bacterium]|nr:PIN domain-containing protein [Kiritimatiellia bacterium]
MQAEYLLDTVVLIDHLNGVTEATQWLRTHGEGRSVISVITRAEVLAGASHDERERVETLLAAFDCLPITPPAADEAAKLRREHGWKLPDAFQAALAAMHRLKLVTRNSKDFSPEKHAFVLIPYER